MKNFIKIAFPLLLLTGCVSEGRDAEYGEGISKQYVVTSAPSFCYLTHQNLPVKCPRLAETNDYLVTYGGPMCIDSNLNEPFEFEWGTSYRVTVTEKNRVGDPIGDCPTIRDIERIDGKQLDPIGTRYTNYLSSAWGGLNLSRVKPGAKWYQLEGYSKPIYCEEDLCGVVEDGVKLHMGALFDRYPDFVLVEIDGKREIALEPHRD